jgi:outer membrane protein assembly factor BamB
MKRIIISLSILMGFFLPGFSLSKQKPGDLNRPKTIGLESLSLLRSQEVRPELAQPVLYDNMIYVLSSRKKIVVFDLSGKKRSEARIKFTPVSRPAISEDRIYVGGDDGYFYCLSLNGTRIWSEPFKTIDFSPPAVDGGKVVFITANDRVVALDAVSGAYNWEYQHLREEELSLQGVCPPLISEGAVYVGFAGGAVGSLDLSTGKQNWKRNPFSGELFLDVDAPLAVDETSVYVVSSVGQMVSLSKKTGNTFWKYDSGGMAGFASDESHLYLATDEGDIQAVDKLTGAPKWDTRTSSKKNLSFLDLPTQPAVVDDYIVSVTRQGKVLVLDKNNGTLLATRNFLSDTSIPVTPLNGAGFLFMDNRGLIRLWSKVTVN